jgi:hypothetical protein
MTRRASIPTPIGKVAGKRRGLPNPRADAMMPAAQGGDIRDKQPNSRMCFVCGVDNRVGLHLAFYAEGPGCSVLRPFIRHKPRHQGYPGHLYGGIISTLLGVPTQISMHSDALSV